MTFGILKRGTSEYRTKMIKTRVRMSDGTVLQGREGSKIRDQRLKTAEGARKRAERESK